MNIRTLMAVIQHELCSYAFMCRTLNKTFSSRENGATTEDGGTDSGLVYLDLALCLCVCAKPRGISTFAKARQRSLKLSIHFC